MMAEAPIYPVNRPKDTPMRCFPPRQHKMRGLTCAPSSQCLGFFYLVVGVLFIAYGVVIVYETGKVTEIETRYDDVEGCHAHWWGGSVCTVPINVTSDLSAPVFLYYSIKSMYLNNRYFSKSKDALQLMGQRRSTTDVEKTCFPIINMGDLGMNKGLNLSQEAVANPCGLLPRAMFNDTFALMDQKGRPVPISEKEIAWNSDLHLKYGHPPDWQSLQWVDVENGTRHLEHFMVWMGVAGLPNFRKLWGRIDQDLSAGVYELNITSSKDSIRL